MKERKQYIEVPKAMDCSAPAFFFQGLLGLFLTPWYLLIAFFAGAPGTKIHAQVALLAVRLLLTGRLSIFNAYKLIFIPMDSTRYFEFHEVLRSLQRQTFHQYLDVSSPRLLPLLLLLRNKAAHAHLLNPDKRDLEETSHLAQGLGLADRCRFTQETIKSAKIEKETFDLITCISVLEHIPQDKEAVEIMWSALKPGGRLVLTLPCMAQPLEQYISHNYYRILPSDPDGYIFWQRYYDEERLREIIYKITGAPAQMIVYGEKTNGLFFRNANMKRLLGKHYPFWRESYMMATEFRSYPSPSELPGEGVIMLEFIKK